MLTRKWVGLLMGDANRVLLLGATGTIGRACLRALQRRGHLVTCILRPASSTVSARSAGGKQCQLPGAQVRVADLSDAAAMASELQRSGPFDAVVSCIASRTGAPRDAWAVDHDAHLNVLRAAQCAGVPHFVLLSAICVQKPRLEFQHAKLAFEGALMKSGMAYTIVRPTAYFKSLTGQIERVRKGKPFIMFGDGQLTASKPISDDDLAEFIAQCVSDAAFRNRVLPIGGPGQAITPLQQGEHLFEHLGQRPRFMYVPVALLGAAVGALSALGRFVPKLADKAELARIGRYYATESMLVWDAVAGCYDAAATPSVGTQHFLDFQAAVLRGDATLPERGDHAVF